MTAGLYLRIGDARPRAAGHWLTALLSPPVPREIWRLGVRGSANRRRRARRWPAAAPTHLLLGRPVRLGARETRMRADQRSRAAPPTGVAVARLPLPRYGVATVAVAP